MFHQTASSRPQVKVNVSSDSEQQAASQSECFIRQRAAGRKSKRMSHQTASSRRQVKANVSSDSEQQAASQSECFIREQAAGGKSKWMFHQTASSRPLASACTRKEHRLCYKYSNDLLQATYGYTCTDAAAVKPRAYIGQF